MKKYGMAAFTKGQDSELTVDPFKALNGYLAINENKRFS